MNKANKLLILFCLISTLASSQISSILLDNTFENLEWSGLVEKVESEYKIRIFYNLSDIEEYEKIKLPESINIIDFLEERLPNCRIASDEQGHIFISKSEDIVTKLPLSIYPTIISKENESISASKEAGEFQNTVQQFVAKVIDIGDPKDGAGKAEATLSGLISSAADDFPLAGVTIFIEELGTGVAADENGNYTITLAKGMHTMVLNHLNHEEKKVRINLRADGKYDFQMTSKTEVLEGITITSSKFDAVQSTKMGFERLTTKSIEEIPLVLGEKDILKVASLLAGVQSVGEGSAGFNVRGSPADQNLFYIDNVPVYNTSHLFGFFSAFNSEAISEFSISKSNIPANFGGRLASIFDITALEGSKTKYKLRGGISPITGNILFEGPIQKDKSSVMIAVRSTYSNWILRQIQNPDFNRTRVNFADAIVKFSQQLSPKSKIQAFAYYSFDDINFAETTNFDNNNLGGSLTWSHFFNERSNLNFSLVNSRTRLGVEDSASPFDAYAQASQLLHQEARLDWTWRLSPSHSLSFGGNAILYTNDRGSFLPLNESSLIRPINFEIERGRESGIYLSDEWKPSSRFTLNAGLRFNQYAYLGPQDVFEYEDGKALSEESIIDTLRFDQGESVANYNALDYRVAMKYAFSPNLSVKASYNTLHQYIFLLSNTVALAPTDKWKLTDYNIEPLSGEQASLGIYGNNSKKTITWSSEFYVKRINRLVEYKDGANLLFNEFPERDVLQGNLDAYGLELTLKKPSGRFNGWINYTYSRSIVLVRGPDEQRSINLGNPYPSNFDRPHIANLVANYKYSRRFSMSANVVYQTGRPITFPTSTYTQTGFEIINFSERNEFRVPDYFRVDLSAKIEGNLKKKKLLHGAWVFSVYNLTGRDNVYNIYFEYRRQRVSGYSLSIFAIPIFSLTYQFKLGNYEN